MMYYKFIFILIFIIVILLVTIFLMALVIHNFSIRIKVYENWIDRKKDEEHKKNNI